MSKTMELLIKEMSYLKKNNPTFGISLLTKATNEVIYLVVVTNTGEKEKDIRFQLLEMKNEIKAETGAMIITYASPGIYVSSTISNEYRLYATM